MYLEKVDGMFLPQHYRHTLFYTAQSAMLCTRQSVYRFLVLPFIAQSINPPVPQSPVHCQTISPFIWPSFPLHQLTDQAISVLESFVHRSNISLSFCPSILPPSVNRSLDPAVKSKSFNRSLCYSFHRPTYNTKK